MAKGKRGPRPEESEAVKPKAAPQDAPPPASAPEPFPPKVETNSQAGANGRRLSLLVDETGRIRWENMRESTRAEVRAVLENPGNRSADSPAQVADALAFTPDTIKPLLGILSGVQTLLAGIAFRQSLTRDEISQVFAYTANEENMLAVPGAALANKHKHRLGWLVKYQEEAFFLFAISQITKDKIVAAQSLIASKAAAAAREEENKPAPNGAEHPTPAGAAVQ